MTKTLTEQWRGGTLPCGAYYVNRLDDVRIYLVTYENQKNTHEIYEVLAPVPSYEEYKELTRRVENLEWDKKEDDALIDFCNKRLVKYHKEIAKLQEQLNEANEALKELVGFGVVTEKTKAEYTDPDDWECTCVADEYLEKWGIPSEKCKEQGDFPSKKCKEVK